MVMTCPIKQSARYNNCDRAMQLTARIVTKITFGARRDEEKCESHPNAFDHALLELDSRRSCNSALNGGSLFDQVPRAPSKCL